jgi:UDP-2-acetamido-3-amino-2,3-dideoxy-glucuronate N-acetyltransferase
MTGVPANDAPYRMIDEVTFGDDVIVQSFVNLYGCRIGAGSRVGPFVEIQRGAEIGRRCKIQSHTFVCEGVEIGDDVFIGHNVVFINDKYPKTSGPWTLQPTTVEDGAAVGSGAVLLGGVRIGANALVGAGAVVTADVSAGATVVGVPARARARQGAGRCA